MTRITLGTRRRARGQYRAIAADSIRRDRARTRAQHTARRVVSTQGTLSVGNAGGRFFLVSFYHKIVGKLFYKKASGALESLLCLD